MSEALISQFAVGVGSGLMVVGVSAVARSIVNEYKKNL